MKMHYPKAAGSSSVWSALFSAIWRSIIGPDTTPIAAPMPRPITAGTKTGAASANAPTAPMLAPPNAPETASSILSSRLVLDIFQLDPFANSAYRNGGSTKDKRGKNGLICGHIARILLRDRQYSIVRNQDTSNKDSCQRGKRMLPDFRPEIDQSTCDQNYPIKCKSTRRQFKCHTIVWNLLGVLCPPKQYAQQSNYDWPSYWQNYT